MKTFFKRNIFKIFEGEESDNGQVLDSSDGE